VESALIPPFPHFAVGVVRALSNLALAGSIWWLMARKKVSAAMTFDIAHM
jgi:hypothetical protein